MKQKKMPFLRLANIQQPQQTAYARMKDAIERKYMNDEENEEEKTKQKPHSQTHIRVSLTYICDERGTTIHAAYQIEGNIKKCFLKKKKQEMKKKRMEKKKKEC